MARLDTNGTASADSYVDWTGCELVERVPGKVSGRPIVRGTRILADTIVQDAELGSPLEEIHENYPDSHLVCPLATCAARAVRVVLDHNLPHKLRTSLGALGKHEIATASYLGWGELKNGELLGMAEDNGIDIFVTGEAKPCLRAETLRGGDWRLWLSQPTTGPSSRTTCQILAAIDSAVPVRFMRSSAGHSVARRSSTSELCARRRDAR